MQNAPFCPIPASGSNFNPQNTQRIPVVKIFAFLGLEQNWTFFKGLYDRMGEIFCIKLEADITKNPIFRSGAK
ncbi:MAG: hypothetical protein PVJ06_11635 [Desulfobacterales bacterium]